MQRDSFISHLRKLLFWWIHILIVVKYKKLIVVRELILSEYLKYEYDNNIVIIHVLEHWHISEDLKDYDWMVCIDLWWFNDERQ